MIKNARRKSGWEIRKSTASLTRSGQLLEWAKVIKQAGITAN